LSGTKAIRRQREPVTRQAPRNSLSRWTEAGRSWRAGLCGRRVLPRSIRKRSTQYGVHSHFRRRHRTCPAKGLISLCPFASTFA